MNWQSPKRQKPSGKNSMTISKNSKTQNFTGGISTYSNAADKKQGATEMKVKELIEQLQQCNPELEVYSWNDHEIHEIYYVDWDMPEWVHLNLGERQ
jgi:hypothetical protein